MLVSKNLFACLHELDSSFLLLRVQSSGLHIMRNFSVRQRLHFLVVFKWGLARATFFQLILLSLFLSFRDQMCLLSSVECRLLSCLNDVV